MTIRGSLLLPILTSVSAIYAFAAGPVRPDMVLKVSGNGRFLVSQSGAPVFLLGDTAWNLASKLTREDVVHYLDRRREQGFNMVFMSGVTEFGGIGGNAYSDRPYLPGDVKKPLPPGLPVVCIYSSGDYIVDDFTRPLITPGSNPSNAEEYDYWDHLEFIIAEAASRGMYVALNAIVATCYVRDGHVTADNAEAAGTVFGKRFGRYGNIVWVLGGDISADAHPDHVTIYRKLARGVAVGASGKEDYSRLTMTYHPQGRTSSSMWLHDEPWLTFNMQQTGQNDNPYYDSIAKDYEKKPVKPVLDGESWYESLPNRIRKGNREATAYDVRKRAYWSVFAGSFGHIYGETSVMQFWSPGGSAYRDIETIHWKQALGRPGAAQVALLRRLVESRPMLDRVPDQTLIAADAGTFNDRIQATRGVGYIFVYSTAGNLIELHMNRISGDKLKGWWFNPRDGSAAQIGVFPNSGRARFQPPTRGIGQDWVLVLDDTARNYAMPGQKGDR